MARGRAGPARIRTRRQPVRRWTASWRGHRARRRVFVAAPASGEVTFAGQVPTHGLTITISTGDGHKASLTHLGPLQVKRGAHVQEGQAIAEPGPSGEPEHAVPYVHLGVRVGDGDTYVDPLSLLPPRGAPINPPPAPVAPPAPSPQPAPAPAPPPAAAAPPAAPSPAPPAPPATAPPAPTAPPVAAGAPDTAQTPAPDSPPAVDAPGADGSTHAPVAAENPVRARPNPSADGPRVVTAVHAPTFGAPATSSAPEPRAVDTERRVSSVRGGAQASTRVSPRGQRAGTDAATSSLQGSARATPLVRLVPSDPSPRDSEPQRPAWSRRT